MTPLDGGLPSPIGARPSCLWHTYKPSASLCRHPSPAEEGPQLSRAWRPRKRITFLCGVIRTIQIYLFILALPFNPPFANNAQSTEMGNEPNQGGKMPSATCVSWRIRARHRTQTLPQRQRRGEISKRLWWLSDWDSQRQCHC